MRIFALTNAEVAQLVELQPSKLVVASSSLVFRSAKTEIEIFRFFFGLTLPYPQLQNLQDMCLTCFFILLFIFAGIHFQLKMLNRETSHSITYKTNNK